MLETSMKDLMPSLAIYFEHVTWLLFFLILYKKTILSLRNHLPFKMVINMLDVNQPCKF